mmetsp:Transcript_16068/g.32143  ORF Transcript_16068/g.32143 Transcript_16068/m.32143 type:complete len:121 (-) Transcript_16068:538-900(-)
MSQQDKKNVVKQQDSKTARNYTAQPNSAWKGCPKTLLINFTSAMDQNESQEKTVDKVVVWTTGLSEHLLGDSKQTTELHLLPNTFLDLQCAFDFLDTSTSWISTSSFLCDEGTHRGMGFW